MNSESLSECKNVLDFQTLFLRTHWRPVDSGRHTRRLSQTPSPYGNWVSIISLLVFFWEVGETPHEHGDKMQTIRDTVIKPSSRAVRQQHILLCQHAICIYYILIYQLYGNQRNQIHIPNESTSTYWHQSTIIFQTLLWFALQINAVDPERVFLKPHGLYGSAFHITVCSKHTRHQVCPND